MLLLHLLFDDECQPRFADARLANQHRDLSLLLFDLFPAIEQQADFTIAPHQRRQTADSRPGDFDTAADFAFAQHAMHFDRLRHTFDRALAQRFAVEETLHDPQRRSADDDRVRFRRRLQFDGDVASLADDRHWLTDLAGAARQVSRDGQPRVNADSQGQRQPARFFDSLT